MRAMSRYVTGDEPGAALADRFAHFRKLSSEKSFYSLKAAEKESTGMITIYPIGPEGFGVRLEPLATSITTNWRPPRPTANFGNCCSPLFPNRTGQRLTFRGPAGRQEGHIPPWAVRELTTGQSSEAQATTTSARGRSRRNRLYVYARRGSVARKHRLQTVVVRSRIRDAGLQGGRPADRQFQSGFPASDRGFGREERRRHPASRAAPRRHGARHGISTAYLPANGPT